MQHIAAQFLALTLLTSTLLTANLDTTVVSPTEETYEEVIDQIDQDWGNWSSVTSATDSTPPATGSPWLLTLDEERFVAEIAQGDQAVAHEIRQLIIDWRNWA